MDTKFTFPYTNMKNTFVIIYKRRITVKPLLDMKIYKRQKLNKNSQIFLDINIHQNIYQQTFRFLKANTTLMNFYVQEKFDNQEIYHFLTN